MLILKINDIKLFIFYFSKLIQYFRHLINKVNYI